MLETAKCCEVSLNLRKNWRFSHSSQHLWFSKPFDIAELVSALLFKSVPAELGKVFIFTGILKKIKTKCKFNTWNKFLNFHLLNFPWNNKNWPHLAMRLLDTELSL